MNKYEIRYYNYIAQEHQSVFIEAENAERAQELFTMRYGYDQDLLHCTYDYYPPRFETEASITEYLSHPTIDEKTWRKELKKLQDAREKEADYRRRALERMHK